MPASASETACSSLNLCSDQGSVTVSIDKGSNQTAFYAQLAAGTVLRAEDDGAFTVYDGIEGDYFFRTGRYTTAASAATVGVDAGCILMVALQSPRSICFHVNSGFDCLREKG